MEENNVIELRHITKSFPGIKANDDITLTLRKGEIHALLGENGAGKSTLMSILFGMYEPDSGEILVNGKPTKIRNPNDATAYGIGMVHQHFKLVGCYTALQNIILGYEPTTKFFGFLRPKTVRKSLEDLCRKYKFNVHLDMKIDDMPVGEQQKVEILKMLYRQNEVLIFDEPTAVLTPQEIEDLMHSMKELVKEGKSILFISHKLNEIMEVADRVSILRKGKMIATVDVKDTNAQELSRLMVGRDVELVTQKSECHPGKDVLTIKNLTIFDNERKKDVVRGVSLNVRQGEIVCLAGIEGNGQTELIYGLTGITNIKSGEAILHDVDRYRYLDMDSQGKEKSFSKAMRYFKGTISFGWTFVKENIKAFFINKVYHYCYPLFATAWRQTKRHVYYAFSLVGFGIAFAWRKSKCFFLNLFKKKAEFVMPVVPNFLEDKKFKFIVPETPSHYSPKLVDLPQIVDKQPRYVDVHLENLSVRRRSISGISHIPEDRQKYGLALDFTLKDNIVLQRYFQSQFQRFGFIKEKAKVDYANRLIQQYDVRSSMGPNTIVRSMSGGNQQKAIIARELDRNSPLLIAVQPTRGLDVGAIESIHREIIRQRDAGSGVLLVSLELDEVMNLSDRILVMFNGEIVAQLDPKKTNVNEIGLYMSGAKRMNLNQMEGNGNE